MLILTVRTDKPEAEIGLYDETGQVAYEVWTAHRQLAETLHGKIRDLLQHTGYELHNLGGIACYAGPGSFTGLRIGLSTVNALAYGLQIPVVAQTGDDWQTVAVARLADGDDDKLALPEYGADVHITVPKR